MNQERAIQLMMLEMKVEIQENIELAIPEIYHQAIKIRLERMYAVGFDFGRRYLSVNSKRQHTRIGKYDESGNLITPYNSVAEAARLNHVNTGSLFDALKYNRKSIGYYWRKLVG